MRYVSTIKADMAKPFPLLLLHEFRAGDGGELLHHVDGQLRASVPPAGFDDYVLAHPECAPIVRTLRGAEVSAVATVRPKSKAIKRRR